MDLFSSPPEEKESRDAPLADRMRPTNWEEFVGQRHLVDPDSLLRRTLRAGGTFSMILWGPPGSGKTTLAQLAAKEMRAHLVYFSAVLSGVKEVRRFLDEAKRLRSLRGIRTILFVDELHRFNKAQQDAFLPHVEKGEILLFGATTENPSFEINSALLSRCHVFVLHPLSPEHIIEVMRRALRDEHRGLGGFEVDVDDGVLEAIASSCQGDARVALNILESMVMGHAQKGGERKRLTVEQTRRIIQQHPLLYDKASEEHYNLISALHKSLRGGDPDAALYWLVRMLESGEDPLYIARRMIRFACEDVGLADPQALTVAVVAKEAFHFLGPPEGNLALAEAAVYLALAPKSNSLYAGYEMARETIKKTGCPAVPLHLRNAPTELMRRLGYAANYRYPHDDPDKVVHQTYLPEKMESVRFYRPSEQGHERELSMRLRRWKLLRRIKRLRETS